MEPVRNNQHTPGYHHQREYSPASSSNPTENPGGISTTGALPELAQPQSQHTYFARDRSGPLGAELSPEIIGYPKPGDDEDNTSVQHQGDTSKRPVSPDFQSRFTPENYEILSHLNKNTYRWLPIEHLQAFDSHIITAEDVKNTQKVLNHTLRSAKRPYTVETSFSADHTNPKIRLVPSE